MMSNAYTLYSIVQTLHTLASTVCSYTAVCVSSYNNRLLVNIASDLAPYLVIRKENTSAHFSVSTVVQYSVMK